MTIQEWRDLLAKTTQGEWKAHIHEFRSLGRGGFDHVTRVANKDDDDICDYVSDPDDAEFIVACHNHLPQLLERLEAGDALAKEIEELVAHHGKLNHDSVACVVSDMEDALEKWRKLRDGGE